MTEQCVVPLGGDMTAHLKKIQCWFKYASFNHMMAQCLQGVIVCWVLHSTVIDMRKMHGDPQRQATSQTRFMVAQDLSAPGGENRRASEWKDWDLKY